MSHQSQVPDASISVPAVTGTMPGVSGDVSMPSVGGVDVDVAAPSVDVDASLPSASIDLPGEYIEADLVPCFMIVRLLVPRVFVIPVTLVLCTGLM